MDRESLVCYEKGGRRVNFDNYTDEVNEWRRLVLQSRGIDAAQTLQYSGKIMESSTTMLFCLDLVTITVEKRILHSMMAAIFLRRLTVHCLIWTRQRSGS